MKILKHGKVNRVITCNCGCEFEYDEHDIQYGFNNAITVVTGWNSAYVICPDCGAKIFIQSPIQTQEIKITY